MNILSNDQISTFLTSNLSLTEIDLFKMLENPSCNTLVNLVLNANDKNVQLAAWDKILVCGCKPTAKQLKFIIGTTEISSIEKDAKVILTTTTEFNIFLYSLGK